MEKTLLTIEQAENKLLHLLSHKDIGDAIYNLVSDLFWECVAEVQKQPIDDSKLASDQMWYDAVREDAFEEGYKRIIEVIKYGD